MDNLVLHDGDICFDPEENDGRMIELDEVQLWEQIQERDSELTTLRAQLARVRDEWQRADDKVGRLNDQFAERDAAYAQLEGIYFNIFDDFIDAAPEVAKASIAAGRARPTPTPADDLIEEAADRALLRDGITRIEIQRNGRVGVARFDADGRGHALERFATLRDALEALKGDTNG